ncbi:hypothetical protein WV31_10630 [Magnetospirillum sp. ME-1]|uniref:DNA cytosine methyltransferase n=1 Tax=Magnetospirillum sp. ME-1 TaxID=1639348 RepID=UPI000A17F5A5|nr:DNA cytosine methyltransferase [Magnetospirillum sp. ME-1]ARJ68119.1 hypothetical protein WV31_10630 [Magnetospirillum sp. ME-1]
MESESAAGAGDAGLRYLSVCSGIEAASVAWRGLGWSPVAFAEVAPFPSAVLAHRFPSIPNLGDLTKIDGARLRGVDLIVGGTPCQAFSISGLRQSLADARGNLSLKFVELVDAADPALVLWENVPGVLNTSDNAFGCLLAGLAGWDEPLLPPKGRWPTAGAVYGPARSLAWRVLDAQHFGVPQRRRRVFLLAGRAGIGIDPAEILFEPQGGCGDPLAGIAPWEGVAACSGNGSPDAGGEAVVCVTGERTHALTAEGADASEDGTGRGTPIVCITSEPPALARSIVRRLLPKECERLQGFPDDWTRIPWKRKSAEECPDGPRYKAVGNSMAVPVMRWIGHRIAKALALNPAGKGRPA